MSRRERKPKVWEDFETEPATVVVREKSGLHRKSTGNAKGKESENENNGIKPEDAPKDEIDTPAKKESNDTFKTPKGRRRSKKISYDTQDESVEEDTGNESVVQAKKNKPNHSDEIVKQSVASERNDKKLKIGIVSKSSDNSGKELNEQLQASQEDIATLQKAVESKRRSKYIEKSDRVIERDIEDELENPADKAVKKVQNVVKKTPIKSEPEMIGVQRTNVSKDSSFDGTKEIGAQKKTPGKKRGRPKKVTCSSVANNDKKFISGEIDSPPVDIDNPDLDESAQLLNTPVSAPVKRRGRRKSLEEVDTSLENTPGDGAISKSGKKRGRKKKSEDLKTNERTEDLNVSKGSSRSGRKRKAINYAALDEGGSEEEGVGNSTPGNKDEPTAPVQEDFEDNSNDSINFSTPKSSRKSSSKKGKSIRCHHCEYEANGTNSMQTHYAKLHQLWWSDENPEGTFERSDLVKVIKIKKFLNCPKCEKQLNSVVYYANHLEWCGREHLKYTCEHCNKDNLVLRWQALHLKTCPALMAEIQNERREEQEEKEENEKSEVYGRGNQRKAAKRAMSVVHNISKEMDPSALSDDSDQDPDVVLHEDDEEDEEEEDFNDDDEDVNEEESIGTPSEEEGDIVNSDNEIGLNTVHWNKASFFMPHPLMEEFVKENWSQELFVDWLPWKQDWKLLSEQESEPYLPKKETSIRFCFSDGEKASTLETLQSTIANDFPIFHTGLTVWQVSWCPMPLNCSDRQFLAVTGKTEHSQLFLARTRQTGPGIIQIWDTGISSNKLETKITPKLCYNIVHDYGLATQMVWCPSGCYKTDSNKANTDSHTRLGLLAVSFTDGTCKIFSLPLLSPTTDGDVPTYRAKPVISLLPFVHFQKDNFTCSSVDWIKTAGHTKIMTGYSNGNVRLFNLLSKSPLQCLSTNNEEQLLPYLNLQPHGSLVRAAQFCSVFDSIIVTSSEDFETSFWDLNNLGAPIHNDCGTYLTISMCSSVWQHGVFIGSDENYAVLSNKGRYLECGNLMYCGQTARRKDERGTYYVSSQPACIWEINCSDWVGYMAACDNRGCINGLLLKDFILITPDCKSYKYRQLMLKTHIKEDKVSKQDGINRNSCDKDINKSEQCKKCNQSAISFHTHNSSENQSESNIKCTCQKTDQSTPRKDVKTEKEQNENQENENKDADSSNVAMNELNTKKETKSYQTLVNNSVLHFEEHFKDWKCWPQDYDSDRYDRPPIAAIKSVCFNPNHLQCCWLAFGGNTGLVRIVNVQKILAKNVQDYLKANKHI